MLSFTLRDIHETDRMGARYSDIMVAEINTSTPLSALKIAEAIGQDIETGAIRELFAEEVRDHEGLGAEVGYLTGWALLNADGSPAAQHYELEPGAVSIQSLMTMAQTDAALATVNAFFPEMANDFQQRAAGARIVIAFLTKRLEAGTLDAFLGGIQPGSMDEFQAALTSKAKAQ